MVRHDRFVRPTSVSLCGALAVAAITAAALSLFYNLDATILTLIWNFGTAILFLAVGGVLGKCSGAGFVDVFCHPWSGAICAETAVNAPMPQLHGRGLEDLKSTLHGRARHRALKPGIQCRIAVQRNLPALQCPHPWQQGYIGDRIATGNKSAC